MRLRHSPLSGALAADQGTAIEHQSGFSLIEVLMGVTVMGIAFVGILGAMATTALSSSLHRSQAVAELEVRRYAALVEAAPYRDAYSRSAPADEIEYDPPSEAPLDFKADDPEVWRCLDAVSNPVECPGGVAQIIRVTVASGDDRVSEWIEFVKRAE